MNEHTQLKNLSMVFHILANYMTSYSGDLFIDFPRAYEHLIRDDEDYPIVFVAKNHADLIDRYESCLIEEGMPHELEDCVKHCQETLGLDFSVEVTPYKVIITNYKCSNMKIRDMVSRLHDIPIYKDEDAVEVVDKTKKDE